MDTTLDTPFNRWLHLHYLLHFYSWHEEMYANTGALDEQEEEAIEALYEFLKNCSSTLRMPAILHRMDELALAFGHRYVHEIFPLKTYLRVSWDYRNNRSSNPNVHELHTRIDAWFGRR